MENVNSEFQELPFKDLSLNASIFKTIGELDYADKTLRDGQRRISNFQIEVEAYEHTIISLRLNVTTYSTPGWNSCTDR